MENNTLEQTEGETTGGINKSDNNLLQAIGLGSKNLSSLKREVSGSMGELRSQVRKLHGKGFIQITEDEEHIICRLSRSGKKQLNNQKE